jgi:hypothetical protein
MGAKILVMGLPGAGKTTLARVLAPKLGAVLFNADAIRANINKDLGFSPEDRIEQARRMGWLCDRVVEAGGVAIADFVCPTPDTRDAFGDAFIVWVDRIDEGRFEDTNKLFVPPERVDVRISAEGAPEESADRVCSALRAAQPRFAKVSLVDQVSRGLAWRVASAKFPRAFSALLNVVKKAESVCPAEPRPIAYLLLGATIVILRSVIEGPVFVEINSLLQFSLLGATMMCGGVSAAAAALVFLLGYDFFLVDPVFTIGTHDWRGLIELTLGSVLAMGFGIAAARAFGASADAP